jgi:hypothetical protein
MDNPEKLTTYGTQDEDKQNKNTTDLYNKAMSVRLSYFCQIFNHIFHGRHSHILIAGFSFFCRRIT